MKIAFRPKLLDCLPGYNRAQFGKDLASGITVGVLALPLAMAFAIASGVSPTAGIWTAIVAGFLTAALGGSRVQIGGPTGAFIPIIYGIVAMHGFVVEHRFDVVMAKVGDDRHHFHPAFLADDRQTRRDVEVQ